MGCVSSAFWPTSLFSLFFGVLIEIFLNVGTKQNVLTLSRKQSLAHFYSKFLPWRKQCRLGICLKVQNSLFQSPKRFWWLGYVTVDIQDVADTRTETLFWQQTLLRKGPTILFEDFPSQFYLHRMFYFFFGRTCWAEIFNFLENTCEWCYCFEWVLNQSFSVRLHLSFTS